MPRAKRSILEVSGKIDGYVVYTTKTGKRVVRKAPQPGSKRDEVAFKKQFQRTKFINKLSSEINFLMEKYNGSFKSKDFYHRLQKLLRKEPIDNRFLLLRQLKGMELNKSYAFAPGYHKIEILKKRTTLVVNLQAQSNVPARKTPNNCHYYKVVLIVWNKSQKAPLHTSRASEWIYRNEGTFEFKFLLPTPAGTINWLLCLQRKFGIKEKEIGTFPAESMYIVDIGTFDKKEEAMLNKLIKDKTEDKPGKRIITDIERVKGKRID